ncbi:hypothetical protein EUTSA_v10012052mg, partial [Eutrema salsugineum]
MLVGNMTEGGDETRISQRESSEIEGLNSLPNEFPGSTNVLVVDSNFVTLLNMKNIMQQYAFEVTIYADAEEAISFLTNCKHRINIVIWDYHMPEINGIQALKIIGEKMDLPVVIMSDDDQVDTVLEATMNGACYFAVKPVVEQVLANIWQHILRQRMMSKTVLIPAPVHVDLVQSHDDGSKQDKDDSMTMVNQDNSEQSIDKIEENPGMAQTGELGSGLVQSDGLDQDSDESKTTNQDMGKKKVRKPRVVWTGEIQEKFLKAIDLLGGPRKSNPKLLLKCLKEMGITGLTRSNISSHLQKYRISIEEEKIPQQMEEDDWSPPYQPMSLLGANIVHTGTSALMNGQAFYPLQENQYQNGYNMTVNNNQFVSAPMHNATSSLMSGQAVYLVQENQYPNGYNMAVNNNQFVSTHMHTATSSLMNGQAIFPLQENPQPN